ncbi:hypothetical protein, partial [Legionella wadsworthii]|uniref:hypothetical protein n=1 Tax=Legionella wadsworthii TaxID=28088 RepID=UPI00055B0391
MDAANKSRHVGKGSDASRHGKSAASRHGKSAASRRGRSAARVWKTVWQVGVGEVRQECGRR